MRIVLDRCAASASSRVVSQRASTPSFRGIRVLSPLQLAVFAGLSCALLNWLLLRDAVWMAPDSWAFWQGSLSLLDGRGYRLFWQDTPIREWPPLYPLYLASWQALFGVSGGVLSAAQSALAGLAAYGWTRLGLSLDEPAEAFGSERWTVARTAQASFVVLFVATRYDCIRADNLKYVFLPALIGVCERAAGARRRSDLLRQAALIGFVGCALMLTHNSSLAFVSAALLIVGLTKQVRFVERLPALLLAASVAVVPWYVVRVLLEQRGSHSVGLGVAAYRPLDYLIQALGGSCTLLIKQPSLAIALVLMLALASAYCGDLGALSARQWLELRVRSIFVFGSLLSLFLLFNLTYITDKLTGRFLFFVPLTLIPALISVLGASVRLRQRSRRVVFWGSCALLVLAFMPRLLDLSHGVARSSEARDARPEQLLHATDCLRRPDGARTFRCSADTLPRLPPS